MTIRPFRCACALLALTMASTGGSSKPVATERVQLLLPRLEGPDDLAANATAVLNLRIWRTFVARRGNKDFGSGEIIWSPSSLGGDSAAEDAEQALRIRDADLILWGSVKPYGEGVVIQPYLRVRPPATIDVGGGAVWSVSLAGRTLLLGLPRKQFEFGPVPMEGEPLRHFRSPNALRLCSQKALATCTGTEVGPAMRAMEHDGPWTAIAINGQRAGWLYLGELGTAANEIVGFAGGLISYLRGDLAQAEEMFAATAAIETADPVLRSDAAALRVVAASRLGRGGPAMIDRLREGDPYSPYVLKIAVMDALQRFAREPQAPAKARLAEVAADVRASAYYADDPWLGEADILLRAIGV